MFPEIFFFFNAAEFRLIFFQFKKFCSFQEKNLCAFRRKSILPEVIKIYLSMCDY